MHTHTRVQGMIIDLNLIRQLLKDILAAPHKEENRLVKSHWLTVHLQYTSMLVVQEEKALHLALCPLTGEGKSLVWG